MGIAGGGRMLRSALLVVALVTAGCESTVVDCGSCNPHFILREELWGSFEHRVEVLDADPASGLEPGTSTEPTRVFFSESEDYLFAIDLDGDPEIVRGIYRIDGRVAVDPEDRSTPLPAGAPRNALRLDWSRNYVTSFASELGLAPEELESVVWFVSEEDDWALSIPSFVRDPGTDVLTSIELPAHYFHHASATRLLLLHRFDRVSD